MKHNSERRQEIVNSRSEVLYITANIIVEVLEKVDNAFIIRHSLLFEY